MVSVTPDLLTSYLHHFSWFETGKRKEKGNRSEYHKNSCGGYSNLNKNIGFDIPVLSDLRKKI